jgi:hypothetical protein
MLENNILLNQNLSESKRDVVTNSSNQNSTDYKFEDAMIQSRQQQLNTKQVQNAARSDHAQQQQRQQQEQIKSKEQANQPKSTNVDDENAEINGLKKTSSTEANQETVDDSLVDSNSEVTASLLDDGITKTGDTEVDSTSWLDTFMKIVAHNEQNNQTQTSTEEVDATMAIDTNTPGDVLTDFLFSSDSSTSEDIVLDSKTSTAQEGGTDTSASELISLFTGGVIKDDVTVNDDISEFDDVSGFDENVEQQNIIASLLNEVANSAVDGEAAETTSTSVLNDKSDILIKSDALNPLNSDVNKSSDASDDLSEKGNPIFATSTLQQQMQQEQNIDSKHPSLLEQSTKANTVLNFVNPALSELSKRQNMEGVESNQLTTDFDDEFEGLKNNPDGSNTSERKLDSELKSILEIKNASVLANSADASLKGTESVNKTDVVDVNGVQLDKTLQLPKLEHSSQVKNETLLRENILFNKQEMANHMQQQIGIMMSKNMKSIDIRLDPPELGSMQIKLTMNNDQAAVSFVVSNQQAKDALEASIPRLRELLEQEGMDLAESDVQHGNAQGESGTQDGSDNANKGDGVSNQDGQDEANLLAQEQLNRSINSPWNVDYYA